ncbi:MAG: protein kinase domain-containing protein [Thermoguttaceae bacterium]|jgi:serine/threonine protein kinase/WD40 repeat protein
MSQPQACSSESELQALLDGTLPEERQAAIADHLETCQACRGRLDSLAGASGVIPVEIATGAEASRSEAFLEAMRKLKADDLDETVVASSAGPPLLRYLSPSANPRHLGRLGGYEILEVIGRGGMGTVLKARDAKLERLVAVKVLNPELASSGPARVRFLREARSAAAVTHEHVVTIHAVEDAGDVPFLVMEYILGVSLEDRIQRSGHLKVEEILRIGMQAASGLAAAHAQGLVHRDIKPSNILLENGVERVKITDFGLARVIHEAQLTQTNVAAGTPQYMSPEQARGTPVDHRSDLFSLGCVMYAMCVGRSPFRAETPSGAIHRVCEDTQRPIREVNPEIPDWLVAIIDRLLEKKPEDRFQTAGEVAEVLGEYLAHVQQPSRVGLPKRSLLLTSSERPKTPSLVWKAVLGAACLGVLALGVVKFTGRDSAPPGTGTQGPGEGSVGQSGPADEPESFHFVDIQPHATANLTDSIDASGSAFSLSNVGEQVVDNVRFQVGERYICLGGSSPAAASQAVRGIEIGQRAGRLHFLHGVQHGGPADGVVGYYTVHYEDGFSDMIPVVEGKHIKDWRSAPMLGKSVWSALDSAGRTVTVYHTSWINPRPDKLIKQIDFAKMPQLGSLLACIAVTCDASCPPPDTAATLILDIARGICPFEVTIVGNDQKIVRNAARAETFKLTPDEYKIQITRSNRKTVIRTGTLRLAAGTTQRVACGFVDFSVPNDLPPEQSCSAQLVGPGGPVLETAFFHNQKMLVAGCRDGGLYFWQHKDSDWSCVRILRAHAGAIRAVALSRDDRLLATGGRGNQILLWDLASGTVQDVLDGHGAPVRSIVFAPNGASLASFDDSGWVILWDMSRRAPKKRFEACKIRPWGDQEFCLAISPDGRHLASGGPDEDEEVAVWDAETGKRIRTLHGVSRRVADLAFTPDGSQIVAADTGGAKFWETATGKLLWTAPSDGAFTHGVAISSDGKMVACGKSQCVRIFDLASRTQVAAFPAHWDKSTSMTFCPSDPRVLATAGSDHAIRIWEISAASRAEKPRPEVLCSFLTWGMPFAISANRLAIAEGRDKEYLRIRDAGDYRFVAEAEMTPVKDPWLKAICCSPDGQRFACAGSTRLLELWHFDEVKQQLERLATQPLGTSLPQLAASPDGHWIAATEPDRVRLFDAKTLSPSGELDVSQSVPLSLAFCPQQPVLAIGTENGQVMLYDIKAKNRLSLFSHGGSRVLGLSFSPEGKTLASAGEDSRVKLWNVATPESVTEARTLEGHTGAVFSVAFSPNGKWLATSGGYFDFGDKDAFWELKVNPGEVKLWDLATGRSVADSQTAFCAFNVQFLTDTRLIIQADCKTSIWDISKVVQTTADSER